MLKDKNMYIYLIKHCSPQLCHVSTAQIHLYHCIISYFSFPAMLCIRTTGPAPPKRSTGSPVPDTASGSKNEYIEKPDQCWNKLSEVSIGKSEAGIALFERQDYDNAYFLWKQIPILQLNFTRILINCLEGKTSIALCHNQNGVNQMWILLL